MSPVSGSGDWFRPLIPWHYAPDLTGNPIGVKYFHGPTADSASPSHQWLMNGANTAQITYGGMGTFPAGIITGEDRPVADGRAKLDAAVAGIYILGSDGGQLLESNAIASEQCFYLDPQLFRVNNAALKSAFRVRGSILTNATAPACNFTFQLNPVTLPTGGAATTSFTRGTKITGSDFTVTTPSLGTASNGASSDFFLPAAGMYVLMVSTSGNMAASSSVTIRAFLDVKIVAA